MSNAIRARRKQSNYIDLGESGTPAFEFMGSGFTDLNEEPGAQVGSKRYINDASSSSSIKGYDWKSPFTADQILSQLVIKDFVEIGELQKTGEDAVRDYVIVDLESKVGSTGSVYKARKIKVCVEVSAFGNEDGEMTCSGNLLGIGDVISGSFDTTAKTFTAGVTVA